MPEQIRFHLDEHVATLVAHGLRRHGVDVTTSHDAGLLGSSDEDQLGFAVEERRVLVTHDADFLRLAARGVSHRGIAYCHLEARTAGQIIRSLLLLWRTLDPDAMEDVVEFL